MDCIILQNTYCACLDLSEKLHGLLKDVNVIFMAEEAMEVVNWLEENSSPDCIIADPEACDGNAIEIFRNYSVSVPLILTCSYMDDTKYCNDLNIIYLLLKPVDTSGLRKALSRFPAYIPNEEHVI